MGINQQKSLGILQALSNAKGHQGVAALTRGLAMSAMLAGGCDFAGNNKVPTEVEVVDYSYVDALVEKLGSTTTLERDRGNEFYDTKSEEYFRLQQDASDPERVTYTFSGRIMGQDVVITYMDIEKGAKEIIERFGTSQPINETESVVAN